MDSSTQSTTKPLTIAVIGAGPIGCYTAYLFAQQGHTVEVFENHPRVGAPIQCTGILTAEFDKLNIPKDSFLVNTITDIEVFSPYNKTHVTQKDYIVCRDKFDNYFADLAKGKGVTIHTSHSFTKLKQTAQELSTTDKPTLIIKDTKNNQEKSITPDIVIAADGPLSPTAKAYEFYYKKRENYYGVQATVHGKFDPNTILTYFGNDVCPGLFAWVTPESNTTARIGLATKKDARKYFDKFMQQHNFTASQMQAGTIPVYHPKQKLQYKNCYLVGDASGYVKATTLGGLVPALQQAQILVDSILNDKNYKTQLKPITRQMKLHRKIHLTFNKFSDKDWDKLVSYVNKPKVRTVFETYTRDNPIPLVTHALFAEPRFLGFLKYVF